MNPTKIPTADEIYMPLKCSEVIGLKYWLICKLFIINKDTISAIKYYDFSHLHIKGRFKWGTGFDY
jgi:hypothetical protein